MDRFHIVVSNFKRLFCFVDNFHRIQGFDDQRDCVYIFDCSPDKDWREQLAIADKLTLFGLRWGDNLFFVRRRNWTRDQGAQLDYFRCIKEQRIPMPTYVAAMQEHYLDLERYVKEDTIPEDAAYDLDRIEAKFQQDPNMGCAFFARYGIRVSTSNPVTDRKRRIYGDGTELLPKARRRGFLIDGSNYVVRPQLYLNYFSLYPNRLTQGCDVRNVWEVRLGQILYDQGIKWADMYRNIEYSTIEELDDIEEALGDKVSMLWYDNRVWFFFAGRDIQRYAPTPIIPVLRYIPTYLRSLIFGSRDTRLTFMQYSDPEVSSSEEAVI